MKWLFFIVGILNIVFASYHFLLPEKFNTVKSIPHFDKTQIVKLNELDAETLNNLQDKHLQEKVLSDEAKKPIIVNVSSEISESIEPGKEVKIVETAELETAVKASQLQPQNAKNLCYKLGPFSKETMTDIRLVLEEEYQNQLSFGIEATSEITYYRIYIPPLKTKENIKETLVVLDKNGLNDHYVMSIDGRKNAIALGVFKKRSAAEKVADKAIEIGLATTIEAISDDKNSLYQLLVLFKPYQETVRFQEIITEKKLISVECENKG